MRKCRFSFVASFATRAVGMFVMLGVIFGLTASTAVANVIVYSNDFTTSAGSEWSNNTIAISNGEHFLGQSIYGFGYGTDTLTLNGLAAHDQVTVSFDLYIIQSWDGNGPNGGGADNWRLDQNGSNLLLTSFANYGGGNTQSYSAATPNGLGNSNAPRSGESDAGHLGFGTGDFGDATYHFNFTFASSASNLALAFTSLQNQSPGDEGWGLDNVSVSIHPTSAVPEPSSFALLGIGGIGLAIGVYRRRLTAAAV
jgi:hypothetical protein